jgi:hypothetical protein
MLKSGLKYFIFLGIIFLLYFSLTCKKPDTPSYTDIDAIKDYINYHPDIFSVDAFDTSRAAPFFREITGRDYWIRIDFHNPDSLHLLKSADVSWEDSIQGVFHTFISGTEYQKNFKAFSRVQAFFEQWGNAGDLYRGWLLIKISNAQIYSLPYSTGFSNLRIDTSGVNSAVNLGGLYELKGILQFNKSTLVRFTIQAQDTSDTYYLHIYERGTWKKLTFVKGTGNDFSTSWTTSSNSADLNIYKHAYVDRIWSKSIADTLSRYNSNAWGIIYKIK